MKSFNPLFMIIFWIAALYFSWSWYQGRFGVSSWEFHFRLQAGLQAFVIEYLEKNIPNVTDIKFTSLWSSYVQDDEIKVFFEYGFKQPIADQINESQLKGWALLSPTGQDIQESWSITDVQINKQSIDYEAEAIVISTVGSIDTPDTEEINDVVLPDREGITDADLSDTSTSSTTSILERVSQNNTDKKSSSVVKTVETSTSSTTTSASVDLEK